MQFSGFSHGQYIRWCTAAEPKSHSTSSPVRVYSAYRHSLSLVHSPMATPVRYLMLLLSKTSSAPSPAASMAALARSRRYCLSRPKSSRSSKSTFIRPGAGARGSAGTAMAAPVSSHLILGPCSETVKVCRRQCAVYVYIMSADFDPGTGLGPRLRLAREERRVSVRELARRIGCSASLISQIERGVSVPSVGVLYSLAAELGSSLDHLLFGADPRRPAADPVTAPPAGGSGGTSPGPVAPGIVQRGDCRSIID